MKEAFGPILNTYSDIFSRVVFVCVFLNGSTDQKHV